MRFFRFILPLLLAIQILSACTVTPTQNASDSSVKPYQLISQLSRQADVYLNAGEVKRAKTVLKKARGLAEQASDELQLTVIYGQLSDAYLLHKQLQLAQQYADKALASSRQTGSIEKIANSLNYLGNSLVALQNYAKAEKVYHQALSLVTDESLAMLQTTLLINLSYLYLTTDQAQQAETTVLLAVPLVHGLPVSKQKVYHLITLAYINLQLLNLETEDQVGLNQISLTVLNEALAISEKLNFSAGLSYANGHLAELYNSNGQIKIAEALFSRALFFAAQNASPELSARWQWQMAGLRQQQGNIAQAQIFYTQALNDLDSIQLSLQYGRRGWSNSDVAQKIYSDYMRFLLQQAADQGDQNQRHQLLYKVRDLLENANSYELSNYFQDECVAAQRKKNATLTLNDRIQSGTAVLYTLIFPDHLTLLLNLANGDIRQFSIPLSKAELTTIATSFRREISQYGNPRKIRQQGIAIYHWLIQPIRKILDNNAIETLVIIPAGILRTIPFAALHDGQQFLIDNFALSVTPGLKLTSRGSLTSTMEKKLLLNGLSESVEGFSPLPFVEEEMSRIEPIYKSTLLLNKDFRYQDIQKLLLKNTYSAIVFATHSQFNRDVNQSYLLSYDGKINLNELETLIRLNQFNQPSIDLLVLSACSTAVGDERAALGMAGAAVKAGASSVVASLWLANDASTATLIPSFFQHLKDAQINKAQALQRAQKSMLKSGSYQHPFHWAGFLLIGNWQ